MPLSLTTCYDDNWMSHKTQHILSNQNSVYTEYAVSCLQLFQQLHLLWGYTLQSVIINSPCPTPLRRALFSFSLRNISAALPFFHSTMSRERQREGRERLFWQTETDRQREEERDTRGKERATETGAFSETQAHKISKDVSWERIRESRASKKMHVQAKKDEWQRQAQRGNKGKRAHAWKASVIK